MVKLCSFSDTIWFDIITIMLGEYMTKAECQEYLRISKSSLEKLVKEGLPRIKLDRKVIFRKVDVDRWLERKINRKK
jgi:excisionase family DNA binding protein